MKPPTKFEWACLAVFDISVLAGVGYLIRWLL